MTQTQAKAWQPRSLESYTDAEKIKAFDDFYERAQESLRLHQQGERDKDKEQYAWEHVMQLLGTGIWQAWNAIDEASS